MLLVNINHDRAARPQDGYQACKRGVHIRAMLQNSHAKYFIERFLSQRNLINAGLQNMDATGSAVIPEVRFHGVAQIERKQISSSLECDLRETPHSAAGFEYRLPFHLFRPLRRGEKAFAAQIVAHVAIELGLVKVVPLISKTVGIFLVRDKSRYGAHDGKHARTRGTNQLTLHDVSVVLWRLRGLHPQSSPASNAPEQFERFQIHNFRQLPASEDRAATGSRTPLAAEFAFIHERRIRKV